MVFPNFIIVGTAKGGTKSLLNYLSQHPDIYTASVETHFFDRDYKKGLGYYSKFFDGWNGEKAIGEKTPKYMFSSEAPKRIYELNPDMKLIFLLRDPVSRAYSNYIHSYRAGIELYSFETRIKNEINPNEGSNRFNLNDVEYIKRGKYAEQIRRYMKYFNKKNMLFIISEEFWNNETGTVKKVCDFLEIEDKSDTIDFSRRGNIGFFPKNRLISLSVGLFKKYNKISYLKPIEKGLIKFNKQFNNGGKYPPMNDETKKMLKEYYEPFNQELDKIIDNDVSVMWLDKKEK
jgi:hypothetical protein